jgi:hypothetical protein
MMLQSMVELLPFSILKSPKWMILLTSSFLDHVKRLYPQYCLDTTKYDFFSVGLLASSAMQWHSFHLPTASNVD